MVKLDQRGDISVAEIIAYVPIAIISIVLIIRHGFSLRSGWIYLFLMAIVRIVGAVAHILYEQEKTPNTNVHIIYSTLESAGVSPLMLATLGFVQTVGQHAFDEFPKMKWGMRLLTLLNAAALGLAIDGGVKVGEADSEDELNSGTKLRHIGAILFVLLYVFIVLIHVFLWVYRSKILIARRQLLFGMTCALPFLGLRILYLIGTSFAPTNETFVDGKLQFTTPGDTFLDKFNSTTGSWQLYLVLGVLTELVVVSIYIWTGLSIPKEVQYVKSGWQSNEELGALRT